MGGGSFKGFRRATGVFKGIKALEIGTLRKKLKGDFMASRYMKDRMVYS